MTASLLRHLVLIAVVAGATLLWSRQCRKPTWWPGRLVLSMMNSRHSAVTDWGLQAVPLDPRDTVLDVGCGGGRTIAKLAAIAGEGKVHGIDYSAASVAAARRTNAEAIASGQVDVRQGSVSHLPFAEDTFDVVTAVETHYYWPSPAFDLREIRRVLKPGGRLAVIAETYKGRSFDAIYRPAMWLLGATYLTIDEHRDLFSTAGFTEIAVEVERRKGWIRAVGTKPGAAA